MKTSMLWLHASGEVQTAFCEMAEAPSLADIKAALRPMFGEAHPERVSVLFDGRAADMFVDEDGHGKRLPRNDRATDVYRTAWMLRHPATDPETLPWIAGDAIIFGRLVWS